MSDTGPADSRRRFSLRTARMEAFSDGIFAIAATLLVLDLVIPAVTSKDVGHKLAEQWPTYVAYLVSFLRSHGVTMIDCQQETGHLASLGAAPIPRAQFVAHLHNNIDFPQIAGWEPIAPLAPSS